MTITLNSGYDVTLNTALLGYVGETNARPVSVEGMEIDGADRYVITIDYGDGTVYEVDITGGQWTPTADILRSAQTVSCQIAAKKLSGQEYILVKKSRIFRLRIGAAIGDNAVPSPDVAMDALDRIDAIGRQAHADMQTAVTAAETATTAANNAAKSATAAEKSADTAGQAAKRAETAKTAAETSATQAETAMQGAENARQQAVTAQNAAKISAAQASASAQQTTADKTATAGYAQTAKTNADNTTADRQAVTDMATQVTADKATVADHAAKVAEDRTAAETAAQTAQAVADSLPDDYTTAVGKIAENTAEINNTNTEVSELKGDLDNIINGVRSVHKDIVWQNGYIDYNGVVKESSISKYAVISLKYKETVMIGTNNTNITIFGKPNSDTVSVGDTVTPIERTSNKDIFEEHTYYAFEDVNIVICVNFSNYELKFYEKPFFLNEDTKVFHITDYVNGSYYNNGLLTKQTNRVRASNFLIINKGESVDVKDIPYGYELSISFFDFNTKNLKYGDVWGGLYPYVAQEKMLMLPVWRRTDNADLLPSEITGDVIIYGTCLSDIKYNDNDKDSVIASNLGIQDKINQANHYRRNDTKPLCLAHISDLHLDKIRLQRFTNFINNIKNIDDAICTGDMTNIYSNGMSYWDSVSGTERILTCIGNHDGLANKDLDWYSGQCTMLEAYNKFINPYISNWNVTHDVGKTYYYKDYESEKIRLIVLDCMRSGADATNQNTWLESVLSSAKSKGYSVVCATHCVPQTSKVNYIDCTFNSINLKYEDEYDTCVTNAIYQQTVQNFIDDDGKFITWICGHTHVDFVYTTSEFPNQLWIVVACGLLSNNLDIVRTDGTKNQDAFNILTFDTNTELVKVIRVGADRDRSMRHLGTMSINYNTHNVIYND